MTAIYLAGGEVETLTRALLDNGVKNILYSFYYIHQMKKERVIARMQAAYPDVSWFLDSGAFTYAVFSKADPGRLMPVHEYKRLYFNYIDEFGFPYDRITELDIEFELPVCTMELIDGWREEMLTRWPDLNITPVWHSWRTWERWTHYCRDKRIKTLAIGRSSGDAGMHRRLLMEARRWGKPVHGFAMTRINSELKLVPMDSVDSTSWVMGQKYGTTYIFRANKFIVLAKDNGGKAKRRLYKGYYKAIGCDPDLIMADDVAEVRKSNIIAWRNLSARFEEMRKRMGQSIHEGWPVGFVPGDPVPEAREREKTEGIVSATFGKPGQVSTVNSWRERNVERIQHPKERPLTSDEPSRAPLPREPEDDRPGPLERD